MVLGSGKCSTPLPIDQELEARRPVSFLQESRETHIRAVQVKEDMARGWKEKAPF